MIVLQGLLAPIQVAADQNLPLLQVDRLDLPYMDTGRG